MLVSTIKPNFCFLNNAAKPFLIWAFSVRKQYASSDHTSHVSEPKIFGDEEDFFESKPVEQNETRSEAKPRRNLYVPHTDVIARPEEEVEKFRNEHEIKIHGKDCPRPILNFNEANFPPYISDIIRRQGFDKPTPIQSQSWPIALSGLNMVGIARTGSGKTLGYLLPAIIQKKEYQNVSGQGPSVLVLAPTRELAIQIDSVARMFNQHVSSATAYGGAPRMGQENQLRRRPDICIATPGRLLDFARNGVVNLKSCSYVVMDEADRMLDMGFEPQIREVMDFTSEDKQVLMWSATWPREIRTLAEDFLKDYIRITVGSEELTANPNIDQRLDFCSVYEREDKLLDFLNSNPSGKTLIFTETKRMADQLQYVLSRNGKKCAALHGDKSQNAREAILSSFRTERINVLIATDVAARGLDIDNIVYVINYEMPKTIESYIHRIGRTARHEKKGIAFSFMTEEDKPVAKDLVDVLKQANQKLPEELLDMAKGSVRINFRDRYTPKTGDNWGRKPFQRDSYDRSYSGSYGSKPFRRNDFNRRDNYNRRDNFDGDDDFGGFSAPQTRYRNKSNTRDNFGEDDDFDNSSRPQSRNRNKSNDDFW